MGHIFIIFSFLHLVNTRTVKKKYKNFVKIFWLAKLNIKSNWPKSHLYWDNDKFNSVTVHLEILFLIGTIYQSFIVVQGLVSNTSFDLFFNK